MSQWLIGLVGPTSAVVIVVVFLIMLRKEVTLRRELKRRRLEHDSEIWYTTGSPTYWGSVTNELED